MKRAILLVALLIFSVSAFAQQRVFTEGIYNKYKRYHNQAFGMDTVNSGVNTGPAYLVGLTGSMAANEKIIFRNGPDTVCVYTQGASAGPISIVINTICGTNLLFHNELNSDVTVIWRLWR